MWSTRSLWLPGPRMGHSAQQQQLCRQAVQEGLPCRAMSTPHSRDAGHGSCLEKKSPAKELNLLPQITPAHAGATCMSCRQERAFTSLSWWKLSSLRFKLPFSFFFQSPSGSAPADGQHKHSDSSISEASICRGFECVSWLPSKCQPAWEGFQPQTSSGQMDKVFFQPGESLLCETCPVKPGHMVALAAEDFMCIIRLPALLSVTAGRSL